MIAITSADTKNLGLSNFNLFALQFIVHASYIEGVFQQCIRNAYKCPDALLLATANQNDSQLQS